MSISVVGGQASSYNVGDTIHLRLGTEKSNYAYSSSSVYLQIQGGGYFDNPVGTYSEATSSSGVPYTFVNSGNIALRLLFQGGYDYYFTDYLTFNVVEGSSEPKETVTTLAVDDYNPKVGDYLIVTPNVTADGAAVSEGTVDIYANGVKVNSTVAGSTCNYYGLNSPGTIEFYAVYLGNDNYKNSTSETITVNVQDNRIPSTLTLSANASQASIGDTILIFNNITNASELDYWTSFASQFNRTYNYSIGDYVPIENITIYLNGEELAKTTVNPNGIYALNYSFNGFDAPGWYNFTASFSGNDKVQASETSEALSFFVEEGVSEPKETVTTLAVDDYNPKVGDYLIVTPNVTADGAAVSEGTVDIYANGVKVNSTVAGSTCNYYGLNSPGTIEFYAVYLGNDNYKNSTSETITVNVQDNRIPSTLTLSANASQASIGDTILIFNNITNASELDYWTSFASQFNRTYNYSIGDYVPIENITIYLNGEELAKTTVNPNGIYALNYSFNGFDAPGWYNFTASFSGNDKVQASETSEALSFFVESKKESFATVTIDDDNNLIVTVTDREGLGIGGLNIDVFINSQNLSNITSSEGKAVFALGDLDDGTYPATITCEDSIYENINISSLIVLKSKEIPIVEPVSANITIKLTIEDGKVIANVTSLDGTPLADKMLAVTIDGTSIVGATTDNNGIWSNDIAVNSTVAVTCSDESGASTTATITYIENNNTEVVIEPVAANITIKLSMGDEGVIAYLTDIDGNALASQPITVYIDDDDELTYSTQTDSNGYCIIDDVYNNSTVTVVSFDENGAKASSTIVCDVTEVETPVGYIVILSLADNGTSIEISVQDLDGSIITNDQVSVYLDEDDDGETVEINDEGLGVYDFDNTVNQTIEVIYSDDYGVEWNAYFYVLVNTEEVPEPVSADINILLSVIDGELVAYVTDLDGKPLTEELLAVSINGEPILGAKTDKNGIYTIKIEVNSTVVVSCSDIIGARSTASIVYEVDTEEVIVPIPIPVVANGTISVENTDDAVEVTLVDSDGKAIDNATIIAIIDGEEQNFTTDAEGKVSIPVAENATVELSYTDPENGAVVKYSTKVVTKVVTEEVEVPVIVPVEVPVVANGTMGVEVTDDAVEVTLVDSDGKAIDNATIIAIIDGEEQNFTTDAEGKVSIPVAENATVELSYTDPENGAVVKYSTKVVTKVVTEEVEVPVIVPVPVPVVANATISLSTEDGKSIIVILNDLDGNAIANATLNAKVNGVEENITTDANGIATIPVSENTSAEVSYTDSNKATVTSSMSLTVIETVKEVNKTIVVPPVRNASQIVCEDMNTIAVAKEDGRIGEYFYVKLVDANGNALANKFVQIGFNGRVYNRTTNETGEVKLQINLAYKGTYTFAIAYLGDDDYNGSFVVSKITVKQQSPKLTTSSKTYKTSAKTKALSATFVTANGKPISDKTVKFTVNGKTYSAKTNEKGIATVKVSLNSKGTYSFTAKYAGDDTFRDASASGKLTIK